MDRDTIYPSHSIKVNNSPIEWFYDDGGVSFINIPSIIIWLNPSLYRMLAPLGKELGFPIFRLLIAKHSSFGTDEDYQMMVNNSTFEEGFMAWTYATRVAGWGRFELVKCDWQETKATVVIHNPWELLMQQGQPAHWGCPFLFGKLIGIFSQAFGVSCWADEYIEGEGDNLRVRFEIYPSQQDLANELNLLREERTRQQHQQFVEELERKAREQQALQESRVSLQEEIVRAQEQLIDQLSTPLLPIHDNIVLMPLIGQMDTRRAYGILEVLLNGIVQYQAKYAILDITGLPVVDTAVANVLLRSSQAIRLLGTELVITGIRPEVAQTLVGLGIELQGIVARSTLQSGIAYALQHTMAEQNS